MCRDGKTVLETPRTPPNRVKIALERGAVGWAAHCLFMSNYYRVFEITVHHLKCRLKRFPSESSTSFRFGNSRRKHYRSAQDFQRRVLSTFAVKSTSPVAA